jgi:hypothetical protein
VWVEGVFAKAVKRYDFPDRKGAGRVFTHNLAELVTLASLDADLLAARQASSRFAADWELVRRWTEESRYSISTKSEAEEMLSAIAKGKDGVFPWIKRHW